MPSARKRPFMNDEFFDNIMFIESNSQNPIRVDVEHSPAADPSPSPSSTASDQYFLSAPYGQHPSTARGKKRMHVYPIDVDPAVEGIAHSNGDVSPVSQGSSMAFNVEMVDTPSSRGSGGAQRHHYPLTSGGSVSPTQVHIPPIPSHLSHCTVEFLRLSWIGSRFGSRVFPHRLESEFAISEPHYQLLIKDLSRIYGQEYYSKWSRHKLLTRILYVIVLMVASMFVVGHVLVVILDQFGIFGKHVMNPSLMYLLIMPVHAVWLLLLGVVITWRTLYPALSKMKKRLILRASHSMVPLLTQANSKEGVFKGRLRIEMHLKRAGGGIVSGLFHGAYRPYLMIYRPPRQLMQYDLEDRAREFVKEMLHEG